MKQVKAVLAAAIACLAVPFLLVAGVASYLACWVLGVFCFASVLEALLEFYVWGELDGGSPALWKALGFVGWAALSFAAVPFCVAVRDVVMVTRQANFDDEPFAT